MAALAHRPIQSSRFREWPIIAVSNPVSDAEKLRYAQIASDFARQAGVHDWEETKLKSKGRVAEAFISEHDEKIIKSPATTTPYTLYIFLHEAAHHFYDHVNAEKPYHVEEYEATHKALEILDENHISLPCDVTKEAAWNVEQAVKGDRNKKIHIEPKVEEFVAKLKECIAVNPMMKRLFDRGEYMVLDEDNLPVHTGRDLSKTEALKIAKEARKAGEKVHLWKSNPAVSPEQYRLAQAVLSGGVRTRTGMTKKVAREIVEKTPAHLRSEWSHNPFYGDLDVEAGMVPAWMYYDSKEARDQAARLYEGHGKKIIREHSMFGYKQGGGKKWRLRAADQMGNPSKANKFSLWVRTVAGGQDYWKVWANGPAEKLKTEAKKRGWTDLEHVKVIPFGQDPNTGEIKRNPDGAAEEMFESFHGEPSDETLEYVEEEHYHSNLSALGELVELKVKLVNGDKAVIGFEVGSGEESGNPFWPFNSFTHTTIYHVGTGEKYKKAGSFKGYTLYQKIDDGAYLVPALDKESQFDTLKDAKEFVNSWAKHQKNPGGPLDEHAAKELELYVENDADLYRQQETPIQKNLITKMAKGVYKHDLAVRLYGHLMESGAKKYTKEYSEGKDWHQIFSPATRKHAAEVFTKSFETEAALGNYDNLLPKKYQKKNASRRNSGPFSEAGKLAKGITRGAQRPVDEFLGAAGKVGGYLDSQIGRALNPAHSDTGPTRLCSNESGTQLYFVGGDQSLDLNGLGITGPQADKENVRIGEVTHITYHTRKIFGKKPEEYDYIHKFSEDSRGPLPVLNYDRINKQLQLSGGMYKIEKPLLGTSPGIED